MIATQRGSESDAWEIGFEEEGIKALGSPGCEMIFGEDQWRTFPDNLVHSQMLEGLKSLRKHFHNKSGLIYLSYN